MRSIIFCIFSFMKPAALFRLFYDLQDDRPDDILAADADDNDGQETEQTRHVISLANINSILTLPCDYGKLLTAAHR